MNMLWTELKFLSNTFATGIFIIKRKLDRIQTQRVIAASFSTKSGSTSRLRK